MNMFFVIPFIARNVTCQSFLVDKLHMERLFLIFVSTFLVIYRLTYIYRCIFKMLMSENIDESQETESKQKLKCYIELRGTAVLLIMLRGFVFTRDVLNLC